FRTPKAFALVVETLLRKGDFRASLALLMNWLGQVEQVPLEEGVHSFPSLALRWMLALTGTSEPGTRNAERVAEKVKEIPRSELVIKFFDYMEANAEDYWQVPNL